MSMKAVNNQITTLKKRIAQAETPEQEECLVKKLNLARQERNRLIAKFEQNLGGNE